MAASKSLVLILLAFALAARAETRELDQFVPSEAEAIAGDFVAQEKLESLALKFVRSLEGRNRQALESITTPRFAETTQVYDQWTPYQSKLNLKGLQIRDLLVIKFKGAHLVRFNVFDPVSKHTEEMAARSWYEIVKVGGEWKVDGFRSEFEPDM